MPSSRPVPVPYVVDLLRQVRPMSILDVGVGFGKYGLIFREYTDIVAAEHEPARYRKEHWKCKIDGIEVFPDYLTPVHDYVYDNVFIGEAIEVVKGLKEDTYDFVWLGDVIEHFSSSDGQHLISELLRIAKKTVVISTPSRFISQNALIGNDHERHLSYWSQDDFKNLGNAHVADLEDEVRLAVIAVPGQQLPTIAIRHLPLTHRIYRFFSRLRQSEPKS